MLVVGIRLVGKVAQHVVACVGVARHFLEERQRVAHGPHKHHLVPVAGLQAVGFEALPPHKAVQHHQHGEQHVEHHYGLEHPKRHLQQRQDARRQQHVEEHAQQGVTQYLVAAYKAVVSHHAHGQVAHGVA